MLNNNGLKDEYNFLVEVEEVQYTVNELCKYKILIADDDNEVHTLTKLILKDFKFEGRELEILETYNSLETIEMIRNNPDTAIILLDVVMDDYNAGLKIVEIIRNDLKNQLVRIIIRTGQPEEAPEERVIVDYEINDYLNKTELSVQRLYTSLHQSLRAYRDLMKIEENRKGLEKIISSSSKLFSQGSIKDFFHCLLNELLSFKNYKLASGYCFKGKESAEGIIYIDSGESGEIVAATGSYLSYLGKSIQDVKEFDPIANVIPIIGRSKNPELMKVGNGFLIWKLVPNNSVAFIFIKSEEHEYDLELIRVFLVNYSLALDGYIANQEMIQTQVEIINTLGDTIEKRSYETENHVRRVSELSYLIAKRLELPEADCNIIKTSSVMHDVGKIGIPDSILLKPGKLDEVEFETIKSHTLIGSKIFSSSNLEVLRKASEICLYHHERYDGQGYPEKLSGEDIPISARIVAIVDVFDALTHIRCYKDAWSVEQAINYIKIESGHQFDPKVVKVFVEALDQVLEIINKYVEKI